MGVGRIDRDVLDAPNQWQAAREHLHRAVGANVLDPGRLQQTREAAGVKPRESRLMRNGQPALNPGRCACVVRVTTRRY